MSLFSSKDKPENLNPEFIQQLTIGRRITPQRIAIHLLFWLWICYENYNDFYRILKLRPELPVDLGLHRFMFLSHFVTTLVTYYIVGYLVLPSLLKVLIYYYATRKVLWRRIAFLITSFFLVFLLFNVYDYYIFGYAVTHFKPVPDYIERNAKYVLDLGPFAFLHSQGAQGFIWAFNLSYLLLPSQLRLIRWLANWGVDNIKKYDQNQKLARNQLKYLQDQINPHFLFNVLNNLYALIHRTNSEAALLLRRLIDYLRYTLYRTHDNFVELKEELQFLQNYVEIEQSRLRDPSVISFVRHGKPDGQFVPPLLLLTFIENAFKHGIHKSYKDGWIDIKIDILEKPALLRLDIKNSVNSENETTHKDAGGLGLYNARQRLNLLFQPDEYKCIIDELVDIYHVQLEIPLHQSSVVNYVYEPN